MRPLLILALLVGAALGTADPAAAQAGPNDTCLMCHSDTNAKGTGGKVIGLDKAVFKGSAHGALGVKCTDCHSDTSAEKLPHPPKLKPVVCANCHEDAVKEYQTTAHAKARAKGNEVAATCNNCHGATHAIQKSVVATSKTNRKNIEETCGGCHGSDKVVQQAHLPGGNVQALYHDSVHDKVMQSKSGYADQAPTCTTCHGTHSILPKSDPKSRVSRASIPDTCGSCHQREKIVFDKGAHGKLRQAGVTAGPGCTDCHGTHTIQASTQPKWQVAVIGQCGNCHSELITSYHLTYHGKVTDLGYANMATCASCHGAHDVRPASDPASPVHADNRAQTCRKCHANAGVKFASWDPHPQPQNKERSAVLYYTAISMNVLLAGVFAFFGLHTILWGYRSVKLKLEQRRQGGGHG